MPPVTVLPSVDEMLAWEKCVSKFYLPVNGLESNGILKKKKKNKKKYIRKKK